MDSIIVCFGELMGRIQPQGFGRIRQAFPKSADFAFAGAEANVAASLQMFGRKARYVSAIPSGPLGDAAVDAIRGYV
jgi:2-dehydro-3-deoxygluconokinase